MNFEVLENAWQKQTVTGGGEPADAVATRLKREVEIAQRRIRGGIALVTCVLLTGWTVAIVGHITAIKRFTPVGLIAEVVYFILVVAFLVRAFRSARVVRNEMAMMGGTLPESLGATLRTVELQIQNARIAGYAIPIVVGVCIWLFVAKYLAGELPGFGAVAGSVFMAFFGAVIGVIIWRRYRTQLAPRREELEEMMQALDRNESV
ncbi:MAG: hypothetical protein EPO07_11725 [Verrucomicrobia bacterium]|nr:MAG: hypothetical protein EPO07_11725 [Verrucomicrobiota bacterium]